MRFTVDPDILAGSSSDGLYAIQGQGDRYGTFLTISYGAQPVRTVWVRENDRALLPHERPTAGDAEAVVEWVADNESQTGSDRLVTLADPVGDTSLGDLLQAFCEAWETSRALHVRKSGRSWPKRLIRIACRGNQRAIMEERYGP